MPLFPPVVGALATGNRGGNSMWFTTMDGQLFLAVAAISALVALLRLGWWGCRLIRPKALRARPRAFRSFPWIACTIALSPWLFLLYSIAKAGRLPPDLPAGSHWRLEESAVSVDSFRGKSRYLRWSVPQPVDIVRPAVTGWVRQRGAWWRPQATNQVGPSTRRVEPEMPCARVQPLFRFGTPLPLLGGHEEPPDPDEPGVTCRVLGDPRDFWHGVVARVRPSGDGDCTVEVWMGLMQDL